MKTRTFQGGVDFQAGSRRRRRRPLTAPVVFVGYGITEPSIGWDELKGLNLKGKIVLLLTEAPGKDDPKSPFNSKKELKDKYFPAGGRARCHDDAAARRPEPLQQGRPRSTSSARRPSSRSRTPARMPTIFKTLSTPRQVNDERPIINKPRVPAVRRRRHPARHGRRRSRRLTITREMANFLLEGDGQDDRRAQEEDRDDQEARLDGRRRRQDDHRHDGQDRRSSAGTNVIGIIEGSDPTLKDEYFVVGAHYDHLGMWEDYI